MQRWQSFLPKPESFFQGLSSSHYKLLKPISNVNPRWKIEFSFGYIDKETARYPINLRAMPLIYRRNAGWNARGTLNGMRTLSCYVPAPANCRHFCHRLTLEMERAFFLILFDTEYFDWGNRKGWQGAWSLAVKYSAVLYNILISTRTKCIGLLYNKGQLSFIKN